MKIVEFNNVKYYVGQSAKENWKLFDDSKKYNDNYIWFHLDSFPSPYVIMYTTLVELQNSDISVNQYLHFGAELCKENSKYKFLKDIKIMYVPIKKLTKTENVGEVDVAGKVKTLKL
jgi:hypothetical protein